MKRLAISCLTLMAVILCAKECPAPNIGSGTIGPQFSTTGLVQVSAQTVTGNVGYFTDIYVNGVSGSGVYLKLDGTNAPSADYSWTKNLSTTGNLNGGLVSGNNITGSTVGIENNIKFPDNNNTSDQTLITNNSLVTGATVDDGFRIRWVDDFFATNNDALVFQKTDGNDADPDGGMVFTAQGNDGVEELIVAMRGDGNVYFYNDAIVSGQLNVTGNSVFWGNVTGTTVTANVVEAAGYITSANFTDSSHYTGFPNRTDTSIAWDDGTYTLTLTATNDPIWIDGKKYYINTLTKQITDATSLNYFWLTASGGVVTLNSGTSHPGFDTCLVATAYWNTTTNKGLLGEERHWFGRDQWWHEWAHETIGARYVTGLTVTPTDTTFAITEGEFYDEDIEHSPSAGTTCNLMYKNGDANWAWDAASTTLYKVVNPGVNDNLRYNSGNSLATATNNYYVAYWLFATNDPSQPYVVIIGQRQDQLLPNARTNNTPESLSYGTLPSAEMKLLYRIIYRNVGGTPDYIETADYRNVVPMPTTTFTATDHGTLSNLNWSKANHSFDTDVDVSPFGLTAGNLTASGNTVVGGQLGVTGNSIIWNNLTVTGNTTVTGQLNVTGNTVTWGNITSAADTDTANTLGRARIGYLAAGLEDYAGFCHIDRVGVNDYALIQDSFGTTYINASNGQNITLRINNATVGTISDTTLAYKGTVSGNTASVVSVTCNTASFSNFRDNGNFNGTASIDWALGNKQKATLTGNCAISMAGPNGASSVTLEAVNFGAFNPSWGANVKWPGGTEPTWTGAGTDIICFFWDGTNYYGVASLDMQ